MNKRNNSVMRFFTEANRKIEWNRGRFLSVDIGKELSTCCFRKRKNREVKAGFGSAVMIWCPTQQLIQWTRSEGFSYSPATALLLAFDWAPCAPGTCALSSCLFGLSGRRLQAINLYMWIPAVAESYKNYQKKEKHIPPPNKHELVLMAVLTHSQDAPLQNITCRTDYPDNDMQREFMPCAMISWLSLPMLHTSKKQVILLFWVLNQTLRGKCQMTAAILATASWASVYSKAFIKFEGNEPWQAEHYNDDQILHCHFVTQPLDKNQWDQQWDTFLWATFITLRSTTVVGESEDVISLLQNFPNVPLNSIQQVCKCGSAPAECPSMTTECFAVPLKQL